MKPKHIYLNFNNETLKSIFQELSENIFSKNEFNFYFLKKDEAINSNNKTIITDNEDIILKNIHDKDFNHFYYISVNSELSKNISKYEDVTIIKAPFKVPDLIRRIVNIFSSQQLKKNKLIELGNFIYDSSNRSFYNETLTLRFTEKENAIFNYLVTNRNKKIDKNELLNEIWKYGNDIDTHTLETHIYSIRKKFFNKFAYERIINFNEKSGYFLDIQKL